MALFYPTFVLNSKCCIGQVKCIIILDNIVGYTNCSYTRSIQLDGILPRALSLVIYLPRMLNLRCNKLTTLCFRRHTCSCREISFPRKLGYKVCRSKHHSMSAVRTIALNVCLLELDLSVMKTKYTLRTSLSSYIAANFLHSACRGL